METLKLKRGLQTGLTPLGPCDLASLVWALRMLTQEQQLQLPARILLVLPQLLLDLLVDPLVLSVLCRHAAPGHGSAAPPALSLTCCLAPNSQGAGVTGHL